MNERLNFANQIAVNVDTTTSCFFTDFSPRIAQKSSEYYEALQTVKDQDGTLISMVSTYTHFTIKTI